jgi:hypothetical protein
MKRARSDQALGKDQTSKKGQEKETYIKLNLKRRARTRDFSVL